MRAAALVASLLALPLIAETPQLVRDIMTARAPASSFPAHFYSTGSVVYFLADDGNGRELWKTDGTRAGTRLVQDMTPGEGPAADGTAPAFLASGNLVYFWRSPGELWRTDGTNAGTFALADDFPAGTERAPVGTRSLVLAADTGLWITDGTAAGTRVLRNDVSPMHLVAANGYVYFAKGVELWRTDGTVAGTAALLSFAGEGVHRIVQTAATGGDVYVLAESNDRYDVYRVTGSMATRLASLSRPGQQPRLMGTSDAMYAVFSNTATDRVEVWRFTPSMAQKVASVTGMFDESSILTAAGDRLYFAAGGPDLWRVDAGGVQKMGGVEISDASIFVTRDRVYFHIRHGEDRGFYVSDGTSRTKLSAFTSLAYQLPIAAIGDEVFFTLEDPEHGDELWRSNGTPDGTGLLKNILPDRNSEGWLAQRLGDLILFRARSEGLGLEPWISDGTTGGTHALLDVMIGPDSSNPFLFTDLGNGRAVFVADTRSGAHRLRSTTGLGISTFGYVDSVAVGERTPLARFPVVNGRAFVFGQSTLWSSDGNADDTRQLLTLPVRRNVEIDPVAAGAYVYFVDTNRVLWRTDGTAAGTISLAAEAEQVHAAGEKLFVLSRVGLSVSDGTSVRLLKNLHFEFPVAVEDKDGVIVFAASGEPWRSDGTEAGTFLLRDIRPGEARSMLPLFDPEQMTAAGRYVYFTADDGVHGRELWRTDMNGVTELVHDIAPGVSSSTPTHVRAIGSGVYFAADDVEHGRELWKASDAGAELVADVAEGPDASLPHDMVALDGAVYFFARTEEVGDELWRVDLKPRRRAVR